MNFNAEKLTKWSKEIHENAVAHGWHEEKHSPEHYLGLIMTEVAEAVEADRKGWCANNERFENEINKANASNIYKPESIDVDFYFYYNAYIKSSVEEEFADIVIRLLDMAYELYGADNIFWFGQHSLFRDNKSFVEHAWYFVHDVLNSGMMNVTESVFYVYCWAEHIGIDLDQHIEWKMRYNALRDYKHGGKKY